MSLRIYQYENASVSFRDDNGVVAMNATEMAKTFGRRPQDYLRLDSTQGYIAAYMAENPVTGNPVTVIQGGKSQGTWMHEDIALDFAQWLSPKFKLWCNARIKELLTTGKVELSDDDVVMRAFKVLKRRTEKAEARAEQAEQRIELLDNTIQEQAPKVQYHDAVLQSASLIPIDKIALQLGLTAPKLNKILDDKGVQYKRSGVWFLHAPYRDKGLAAYKTHPYTDSLGRPQTAQHLQWSETGRKFIIDLLSPESTSIQQSRAVRVSS